MIRARAMLGRRWLCCCLHMFGENFYVCYLSINWPSQSKAFLIVCIYSLSHFDWKKTPPPGGGSYLLGFLIKNRE